MDIWLDIPSPIVAVLPRRVILPLARPLIIGLEQFADIGLTSTSVNPRHCEVGRDGCGAYILDLNSYGGTFVNERQVGSVPQSLLPNDLIGVGGIRIRAGWNFVVDPFWLRWEAGLVPSLARRIRDEGDYDAMPILADALEDVGCTESGILEHMRGPGPHVPVCWVIDAILNPRRGRAEG